MASGTVARATVAIARQSVLSVSLPQRYADFLNDCPKVVMMLGICALRWSGALPAIALSRSFCSMSFQRHSCTSQRQGIPEETIIPFSRILGRFSPNPGRFLDSSLAGIKSPNIIV